ncbi:acyl-CoA dehydrogenase family protein [Ottowia caeni]|uniref:acyl-CoA dehydrogenase family protein n=1 Tax=Ottowia caeni TaxID=2870339 RepID=UPI001E39BE63|nr:acyl-CoA dehydrogenase family protein [Ottowia caeni]
MNLHFTPEQDQLRAAVRRWVERQYGFERRRKIVAAGGFEREAYAEMAALGLAGLCVPSAHDGLGMGPIESMIAMEELGAGLVLEPIIQSLVSATLLSQYADPTLRKHWLPAIASGEALVVLAHQESGGRYQVDRCTTSATRSESGWTISGTKILVAAGDCADAMLVSAQSGSNVSLFLVNPRDPLCSVSGHLMQDGSRAAEVVFKQVPAALVTADGGSALADAYAIGVAGVCAFGVGAMERMLASTVEYMKDRKQFGAAIASFQALRHRVADMKLQLELARSMSYYASLKLSSPAAVRDVAIARAKVQLGASMRFVGQQAVQLHGGIGMTDELPLSHYFKALTQLEMSWGDTVHHLELVSNSMGLEAGVLE